MKEKNENSFWMNKKGLSPKPSPLTPVIGHPNFTPSLSDSIYSSWIKADVFRVTHLRENNQWVDLRKMEVDKGLERLGWLRHGQIRHYLKEQATLEETERPLTQFEKACLKKGPSKRTISPIYRWILEEISKEDPPYIRKWETELGKNFTPEEK